MLAHDVGWSVLDVAFSPDGEHFAYSSWADCCKWRCDCTSCSRLCDGGSHTICVLLVSFTVYQCHVSGHSLETLPLSPGVRRFCVFSVAFSKDGTEILSGANDQCLYMYDLECQQRILRVRRISLFDSESALAIPALICPLIFIVHGSRRRRKQCCLRGRQLANLLQRQRRRIMQGIQVATFFNGISRMSVYRERNRCAP